MQLQTRLRNHATTDHKIIVSTNPDMNHIRTELLLKSDAIYGADREYFVPMEDKNPSISVHIASTRKNVHLPADYYYTTAFGKPSWWVARYLDASFMYSDGLVYSTFADHLVDPFEIPKHWQRAASGDFGIRHPTALLMGAIDPDDGTVYIYDEYYKAGLAVPQNAEGMKALLDPLPHGTLRFIVGDPAGKRRNMSDLKSLFDHYAEYGIYFQPGTNRIEAGIAKVHSYFSMDKLKIFKSCSNTIREGLNYKYKPMDLSTNRKVDENPIDIEDDAMDCIKYMIAELPDNPKLLIRQSYNRNDLVSINSENKELPHALQDQDTFETRKWQDYY